MPGRNSFHIIETFNHVPRAYMLEGTDDSVRQHKDLDEVVDDRFAALSCKGFSYQLVDNIELGYAILNKAVKIRIALYYRTDLTYPRKVKEALSKFHHNHSKVSKTNFSIGFALGIKQGNAWIITVLQSDIMFSKSSAVRDHFRGWRKVLFHHIIDLARKEVKDLYLTRAEDVYQCCKPNFKPTQIPQSWYNLYDDTASYFDMTLSELDDLISIQPYFFGPKHEVSTMYKLRLA